MKKLLQRRILNANLVPLSFGLACLLASLPLAAQRPPDLARRMNGMLGSQGRLIWIDGTANLTHKVKVNGVLKPVDYITTKAGVEEIVQHCKQAHINTLVVDVKPLSGQVLYNSKVAPHMREWRGRPVPDFDVLAAFVEAGHKAGLQVDADINTLSEGHKLFGVGLAYQHTDWQSIVYTVDRGMIARDGTRLSVHVSGEPSDALWPALLTDDDAILGDAPTSGMVGLESTAQDHNVKGGGKPFGKQLNVVLDGQNRVVGMVDSSLLGDDPLLAPEDGHLVTATRAEDRGWLASHVKSGDALRFDLRTRFIPGAQAPSEKIGCFINPLNPEARNHELEIVRELVTNYDIDGLVLDRCRYANINNDFSDRSREAFAHWLGKPVNRWPEDIFAFNPTPGGEPIQGPLYKQWLEFRAQTIRDLVADIARCARSVKPQIVFGTYVGSWYPRYYEVGVNWGSEKNGLRYSWFTDTYPRTGYAEYFDWIATGCYYPIATREDARREGLGEKGTVEFAADLSDRAVASGAFVYPGLYVPDYLGDPDRFLRALDAAGRQAQGWMIFDLTYIEEYNWWSVLERAYRDAPPPDRLSDLLPAIRSAVDAAY